MNEKDDISIFKIILENKNKNKRLDHFILVLTWPG
jgi:hypothetical protein